MSGFAMKLPGYIVTALERLEAAGHKGWLVGGCVRDAVMGVQPHDYDITASSTPEETIAAFEGFRVIETGIRHGTVTVMIDGEPVEITTFRVESEYLDNRHPSGVSFARRIEDDLLRRDFTMNAMAYRPDHGLLDLYGGQQDISDGVIRCVGDAAARFDEDGLRILRALRFASRLGLRLEEETRAHLLGGISAERVYSELCGIIVGKHAGTIVREYARVLAEVIPELSEIIGFEQHSKYHCCDVLEHTCRAMDNSAGDLTVRLALLLHDIAKPRVCKRGADGCDHYLGHPELGAQMADDILRRLRADNRTRETVVRLIELHDCAVVPDTRRAKRLLRQLSYEEAMLLMEIKLGDRMAHAEPYRDISEIIAMKELLTELHRQSPCLTVGDMALGGSDLIAMGMKPGKAMGRLLGDLLEMVVNDSLPNEKAALAAQARLMMDEYTEE